MLAVTWSLGAAPEVNLRNLQWTGDEANKGINPGFEIHRTHHQKSKTRVPVVPQKNLCPPTISEKKETLHFGGK